MTKTFVRTLALALFACGFACGFAGLLAPPAASARSSAAKIERLLDRGRKALSKGRYEQALERFSEADELTDGASPEAVAGLADAYLGLDQLDDAIDSSDRLLEIATDDRQRAKAQNVIALAYFRRAQHDRWNDAEDFSQRIHKPEVEEETARLDDEMRRRREATDQEYLAAADAFRRVIELTGGKVAAPWQNYAEALFRGGRFTDARRVLDEMEARLPEGAELPQQAARLRTCLDLVGAKDESPIYALSAPPEGRTLAPPERVYSPQPQYTELARINHLQGTVIVQGVVDREGRFVCGQVVQGLPMGLGDAALRAILTWRFKPATLDGEPVSVHYWLTTTFALQ